MFTINKVAKYAHQEILTIPSQDEFYYEELIKLEKRRRKNVRRQPGVCDK